MKGLIEVAALVPLLPVVEIEVEVEFYSDSDSVVVVVMVTPVMIDLVVIGLLEKCFVHPGIATVGTEATRFAMSGQAEPDSAVSGFAVMQKLLVQSPDIGLHSVPSSQLSVLLGSFQVY